MRKNIVSIVLAIVICSLVVTSIVMSKSNLINANKTTTNNSTSNKSDTFEGGSCEVETSTGDKIIVEIKGAVAVPGVYEMNTEDRIFDLINISGGLVEGANIEYINQSRILTDQLLVIILTNDQIAQAIANNEVKPVESSIAIEVKGAVKNIKGSDPCFNDPESNVPEGSDVININTATVEDFTTLPGIGEAKAKDIITYRTSVGGFENIEEIMNVSGIGEATFNKIKSFITV